MNASSHLHWTQKDPKDLRVLLSNDDGIDAPGIALLEKFARKTFGEVWVVAPADEQSAKSRALTVRRPIEFEKYGETSYAVHGTPVDCIIVALNGLMKDAKPDLVLSGVNNGANLAEDVGYSGTIGCAFEAMLEAVPSIAFSQCYLPERPQDIPWHISESHLGNVIDLIKLQEPNDHCVYNVNFPPFENDANTELFWTTQGRRENKQFVDFRQSENGNGSVLIKQLRTSQKPDPKSDLAVVKTGHVSITSLAMEQCLGLRPFNT